MKYKTNDGKFAYDVLAWLDTQSYVASDHPMQRIANTLRKNIREYKAAIAESRLIPTNDGTVATTADTIRTSRNVNRSEERLILAYDKYRSRK